MSESSPSVANSVQAAMHRARALVWDAPTRAFHWLLALSFVGAYLTSESHHWRSLHMTFGYTMAGLIAFRVVWGLVGTRHARFSSFVRGPAAVARYLRSLLRGKPEPHAGHNPAGAIGIVALLVVGTALVLSGIATAGLLGVEGSDHLHEAIANAMLAMVAVHVAAVIVASLLHRENLVTAMISGRKPIAAEHAIPRAWRALAAVMAVAVLGFWSAQWQGVPVLSAALASHSAHSHDKQSHAREHDDD